MNATKLTWIIATGMILTASCSKYPPASERLLEDLVVYTKYDTKANFKDYNTFYMSDSVTYIDAKDTGWYYNQNVKEVTHRIAANLTALGYTRSYNSKTADLALGIAMVKNINVSVYYPGWWWGYPGYYPPDYWGGYQGYYYPYYPVYVSSYSTGTILIDMMDLKYPTAEKKIAIRWNAVIRALLTGRHTLAEVEQAVDQAFRQTKGFYPSL